VLHDFSLRVESGGKRHFFKVCFSRGVRWSVTGFRVKAACDEADDSDALFEDESAKPRDGTAESASALAPSSPSATPTPAGAGGTASYR
jgi:hypothetical protein